MNLVGIGEIILEFSIDEAQSCRSNIEHNVWPSEQWEDFFSNLPVAQWNLTCPTFFCIHSLEKLSIVYVVRQYVRNTVLHFQI